MIARCLLVKFYFYKVYLLGWPLGRCTLHEKIEVPNNKDHRTLSVPTEICNTDFGILITQAAVTVLWHPWVSSTKELVQVSEILSYSLLKDHHWGILVLVCSVKLMGVQYSTPALNCIQGKHLWGMLSWPWGYNIYVYAGSACWWCASRHDQSWPIVIEVHYYILVLAKLSWAFVPSVISRFSVR